MNAPERMRATYAFEPVDHLYRRARSVGDRAGQKRTSECPDDVPDPIAADGPPTEG